MRPRVILASGSPRRHDLLTMIGIAHEVVPADIDESLREGEPPEAYVERLAREKGAAVAGRHPDAIVISADTTVVVDGLVLAKPADDAEAARMLRRLRGRSHVVHTAVAVTRRAPGVVEVAVESPRVWFRALGDDEIEAYVATGEPLDKAGAYGIQGYGATIVERVDGDYFAVMGLPLCRLVELLGRAGAAYAFGPLELAAAAGR